MTASADLSGEQPFADKRVRSAVGLSGAIVVAVVAIFILEGWIRWLALAIAALDAVLTPYVLGLAVQEED